MTAFICGENGFTIRLFDRLARSRGELRQFLGALKPFQSGGRLTIEVNDRLPEVWLFPSFGRCAGFGEPDALLLWPGYAAAWIEVEHEVRLSADDNALIDALLQLYRFHRAGFAMHGTNEGVITGWTITNAELPKLARMRVAEHYEYLKLLRNVPRHELVLLTIHRSTEPGWETTLADRANTLFARWDDLLAQSDPGAMPRASLDNCWYASWEQDLFTIVGDLDPERRCAALLSVSPAPVFPTPRSS